jgi:N-methylhydantoinase A
VFDPAAATYLEVPVYRRDELAPGCRVRGPALIAEEQTTTVVAAGFAARIDGLGTIVLTRSEGA